MYYPWNFKSLFETRITIKIAVYGTPTEQLKTCLHFGLAGVEGSAGFSEHEIVITVLLNLDIS